MAKTTKPDVVKLFENLLWANSPKHWVLKTTYFQQSLYVSMSVPQISTLDKEYKTIRRKFTLNLISERSFDIYGLAKDCVDQMVREERQRG